MNKLSQDYVGFTLSEGTLREEDLLDAFEVFAANHITDEATQERIFELIDEAEDLLSKGDPDGVVSIIINEEIWAIMDEIAPEGTMFGAHEGDGAAFGFWSVEEEETDIENIPYYLFERLSGHELFDLLKWVKQPDFANNLEKAIKEAFGKTE
jgi:hypothetical protein